MANLKKYPLFPFYQAIKNYDSSLNHQSVDFDTYLLLLEHLQLGYGFLSEARLYALCKSLLFKPHHKETVFKEIFYKHLNSFIKEKDKKEKLEQTTGKPPTENIKKEIDDFTIDNDIIEEDYEEFDPEDELLEGFVQEQQEIDTKQKSYQRVSIRFEESEHALKIEAPTKEQMNLLEEQIYAQKFILKGTHLPLPIRKLAQGIKSLRDFNNQIGTDIIDIEATIEQVSNQGYLTQPVLEKTANALTPLTILIDWGGSMVAFHHIADELIRATYAKYKKIGHQVYYFHDYPVTNIYTDKERVEPHAVDLLKKEKQRSFLVFSDAGAARNSYSEERLEHIKSFMSKIAHRPYVWLNPMPANRWQDSSAEIIAQEVQMFDVSQSGFLLAMKWLKTTTAK